MAERNAPRKAPHRNSSIGCLIWLLILLLIFVLFFLNRGTISKVIENTKFLDVIKTNRTTKEAEPGKRPSPAPAQDDRPEDLVVVKDSGQKGDGAKTSPGSENPDASMKTGQDKPPVSGEKESPGKNQQGVKPVAKPSETTGTKTERKPVEGETAGKPKIRLSLLYFVKVDDDGIIVRQESKRNIQIGDSPLESVLASLLEGPTNEELRKGFISLVPVGTKLLSVAIQGSTAILNFSEKFMFNSLGIEGYAGQLKQVVYTATEFANVHDVQFLIEGQRRDYLGGEGVYIGRPLSRNSF